LNEEQVRGEHLGAKHTHIRQVERDRDGRLISHRMSSLRSLIRPLYLELTTANPREPTRILTMRLPEQSDAGTGRQCMTCGSSVRPCQARTPTIRSFGGCATCATPTISCSDS